MWYWAAGNQSPDPLIDFPLVLASLIDGWESVTRPLDRLRGEPPRTALPLGISHQTP